MSTFPEPRKGTDTHEHGPTAPHRVRRPVMRMTWENLTFLHWAYPPGDVQRLLPEGIEVEPRDGKAWVSLVPLYMRVRPPFGPAVPGLTTFPETNVRTYVTGPGGEPGVWFFSLDATNPAAVAAGRATLGLPYFVSKMDFTRDGNSLRYEGRRAGRQADRASHRIEVEAGEEIAESDLTEFDHFLTARFRMWSVNRGVVLLSDQEHAPWQLRRATVGVLEQDLLQHAGLPRPTAEPVVHFADRMEVRVGPPHFANKRQPKLPRE